MPRPIVRADARKRAAQHDVMRRAHSTASPTTSHWDAGSLSEGPSVGLWVNPPETPLPLTEQPLRFAIGTPLGPSTNSWRVWVHGNDTYVACRDNFREIKVSLHASGVWRVGFTRDFVKLRPDMLPDGKDRVWKKWTPRLDEKHRSVVGFQVAAPTAALYIDRDARRNWPTSIVFVEPPPDPSMMTVISVVVVLGRAPVKVTKGNGLPIALVPLGESRTVQLVATYEEAAPTLEVIKGAFGRAVAQIGGPKPLPAHGTFLVLGNRGEDIPWLSAVPFQKVAAGPHDSRGELPVPKPSAAPSDDA